MTNRPLQTTARVLALALLYFATGWLGLKCPVFDSHITLLWLPTGFSVAVLLRCGFHCWPGVALGALAVILTTGTPWLPTFGIVIGNTAGPLLVAWLLRKMDLHAAFDRRRDILILAGAAAIGMLVSASVGTAALAAAGELTGTWLPAWLVWWAGDIMGVIAAAPFLLSLTREEWRKIAARLTEFLICVCTIGLIAFVVFFMPVNMDRRTWVPSNVTLPLVAWAAMRFGTIGTSLSIIMLAAAAAAATAAGDGPFCRQSPTESVVLVWIFMATCATLGWLVNALHASRAKAVGMQQVFDQALKTSTEFTGSLFDSMQDGFSVLDASGVQQEVNPALCGMTGFSREELIGRKPPYPYWPPEEYERIQTALAQTLKGGFTDFELTFMRKNGERFPVIVSPSGIKNKVGEFVTYLATVKDITERKRAEEALNTSAEFNKSLIGSMQDGLSVLDLDGVLVDANPALCKMTGFSREELIGSRRPFPYWPPEEVERIQAAIGNTLKGQFASYELTYMRKNGERFPVVISPSGVKNKEGAFVNYVATLKDITDRKRAEEALRMATQKLKLHFEQTPMAVIEWDLEFRVTQWNPAAEKIFGFTNEEALRQHAAFIVPEKYRPHVGQVWEALLKKSGGERSSNENVRKDGASILCEWYNTPLIDGQGKVVGVASVVMDITDRRQAQQLLAWEKSAMELIGSTASLHDVLEGLMYGLEKQAPGGLHSILLLDDDGVHLRHGAAPSLPEAYNRAIDGVAIGPTVGSCGTAAYTNRQVIVSDIATDPLWADYRELALAHNLRACWSTPIKGSEGKNLGTFAIYYHEPRQPLPAELDLIARATNIIRIAIERKRADEALRESELKFRTLFENAGDAIFLLEGNLFVDCNVRTLEMFGCQTQDQIVGHPPHEFSPELQPDGRKSLDCAMEKINAAFAGHRQFFEWLHTKFDGTPFPAEVTLNKVTVGGRVMLQAFVRDISERKRAEAEIHSLNTSLERRVEQRTAELQIANKELEAFTYSVSHDLRAPLRAVDGFSRIVLQKYNDRLDEEGRKMLGMIRQGAAQMGHLIDDLLTFSRVSRQTLEPVPIDMRALAQAVFDTLAALEPARRLWLDLHALPAASGTQPLIRQVWANLIGNAIKFTKHREVGEIEIGTKDGGDEGPIYYIKDNGAGFDMRHADKLFGVFVRLHTADEFEGTGVGLALVQRIVQRHGGRIWAEGKVNGGATFYFTLPPPKT